jgi:hypothetical protein
VNVPQWPPASGDWTISASIPACSDRRASVAEVTVWSSVQPARLSSAAAAGSGSPKVNDTTGGAASTSASTLSRQPSSSSTGVAGSSTP